MSTRNKAFAYYYEKLIKPAEVAGLADLRRDLLRAAHGNVLEVGIENANNARYYELQLASVNRIPYSDSTFDTVAGTFVHCSIRDPITAVNEIYRVLRVGGTYIFLEHVICPDNAYIATLQKGPNARTTLNSSAGAGSTATFAK